MVNYNYLRVFFLTIDDGGRDKIAVDMLTEYKMYATIFFGYCLV